MLNALTIDVEDYFQVTAFEGHVDRGQWDSYELRVAGNTRRILAMLDEFGIKATFFVLGWVAEREPLLVKEIASRGHEIACHGFGHELVYRIGAERFRNDIRKAKALLEDIGGAQVHGYRAPSYSITSKSLWALDILIEEGFSYDSSIFPVYHDNYGIPDAPRFPHDIVRPSGVLREFPLSTLPIRIGGREFRLPIAGGGYLRLFPAWVLRQGLQRINSIEGQPTVLYFHPWEIDPEQPRIPARLKSRFRHYLNLRGTEGKLRDIMGQIQFGSMAQTLEFCQKNICSEAGRGTQQT
jgi:polysaccharide deacetylase family protein (PEP-CTERM system associated)